MTIYNLCECNGVEDTDFGGCVPSNSIGDEFDVISDDCFGGDEDESSDAGTSGGSGRSSCISGAEGVSMDDSGTCVKDITSGGCGFNDEFEGESGLNGGEGDGESTSEVKEEDFTRISRVESSGGGECFSSGHNGALCYFSSDNDIGEFLQDFLRFRHDCFILVVYKKFFYKANGMYSNLVNCHETFKSFVLRACPEFCQHFRVDLLPNGFVSYKDLYTIYNPQTYLEECVLKGSRSRYIYSRYRNQMYENDTPLR